MGLPQPIQERLIELYSLVEKYPLKIPVAEAAKFLGMDKESLRNSIREGRCCFGIGSQKSIYSKSAFTIPTLVFYSWVSQGALFRNEVKTYD